MYSSKYAVFSSGIAEFQAVKIMVLSFAKCGVFCIFFPQLLGMEMEDDWICRHRHACNTHPEQDIRAG